MAAIVDAVATGDHVEIKRRGRPVAVVVSKERYAAMAEGKRDFTSAYADFVARFDLAEDGFDRRSRR